MDVPPSPRSFGDDLRARVLSHVIRYRARLAPGIVAIACVFVALDPSPLRIALFSLPATVIVVLSLLEHRLAEKRRLNERRERLSAMATATMQLWVIFASGGIASPILPAILILTVVLSVTFEPRGSLVFVFGVQVPLIWAFAAIHRYGLLPEIVPPAYGGMIAPPGTPGSGPFLAATFVTIAATGASVMGRRLRGVITELVDERLADRTKTLGQLAESSRAMAALSGEIAHELKNPLASIKGLAALVRKDLDGRSAERMEVLRAEVDRMQGILDEFLAHARPLVPLSIEDVDVLRLCRDVAAMHEGTATERNLRILAHGEPIVVRCDPRKVRQIAINLVQNAIEASPRGESVELAVERDGSGCTISVRDHGSGIDPAVKDRLFEVGATTKARGTGLGLVVARGLARQHGGELVLESPDGGGGCAAILRLPAAPPERSADGAATEAA